MTYCVSRIVTYHTDLTMAPQDGSDIFTKPQAVKQGEQF